MTPTPMTQRKLNIGFIQMFSGSPTPTKINILSLWMFQKYAINGQSNRKIRDHFLNIIYSFVNAETDHSISYGSYKSEKPMFLYKIPIINLI